MLVTESKPTPVSPSSLEPVLPWKRIVSGAEPFLRAVNQQLLEQVGAFEPEIARYARYALTRQGKQLRPALVALSGQATGKTGEDHIQVAVIIEMVHLATLVHDDVMDEASLRRGRPTVAAKWGNEIAVLLGDCLFAQALKLAAGFPTTEICRAVSAATNTVCAGEILQTQARHNVKLSHDEYFKMLRMKTGELFAVSCDLGAFLSGADAASRSALRQYGLAMGTAYQVFDDCLDLFGSEKTVGKSLGTDLAKGKLTLPILLLLGRVDEEDRDQLVSWLAGWQSEHLTSLQSILSRYQVLPESQKVVEEYLNLARHMLEILPPSESQTHLRHLTVYLGQQMQRLGARQLP